MDFIGASITSVISFILGLVGHIFYGKLQGKHNRQNEALKKHFADLAERYIKPTSGFLSNISNQAGVLKYTNVDAQYSIDASQTSWPTNNVNQDFICFKEHFPAEASEISELKEQIVNNNASNKTFNSDLENLLEKKSSTPVKNYFKKSNLPLPFFEVSILLFLRLSYREIEEIESGYKEDDDYLFNFQQTECLPDPQKGDSWLVQLKGRGLAKVRNNNEAEICKQTLIELTYNSELQSESQRLHKEAESLKIKATGLSNNLHLICEQHEKFGRALKRKRNCPVCNLIFE